MLKTFEELEVYKRGVVFRIEISQFCKLLPKEETYRMKDQMLRASRSITANIAEGFGRHHHQENSQFCRQARGSLSEMLDHLGCARDEGFLSEDRYVELRKCIEEVWKLLNGYIAYLQKCAMSGVPKKNSLLS